MFKWFQNRPKKKLVIIQEWHGGQKMSVMQVMYFCIKFALWNKKAGKVS